MNCPVPDLKQFAGKKCDRVVVSTGDSTPKAVYDSGVSVTLKCPESCSRVHVLRLDAKQFGRDPSCDMVILAERNDEPPVAVFVELKDGKDTGGAAAGHAPKQLAASIAKLGPIVKTAIPKVHIRAVVVASFARGAAGSQATEYLRDRVPLAWVRGPTVELAHLLDRALGNA